MFYKIFGAIKSNVYRFYSTLASKNWLYQTPGMGWICVADIEMTSILISLDVEDILGEKPFHSEYFSVIPNARGYTCGQKTYAISISCFKCYIHKLNWKYWKECWWALITSFFVGHKKTPLFLFKKNQTFNTKEKQVDKFAFTCCLIM